MAVGALSPSTPKAPVSGYQPPSHWYDDIKSIAQPVGAWALNTFKKSPEYLKTLSGTIKPTGNFWRELGVSTFKSNVMSALMYDGLGSAVRNGLLLIQGKEKVSRAAGNIAADISVGAGKGIVSGLAITGVTMGMTAIGLTAAPFLLTVPVMLGASIAANWLTHKLMNKGLESTQLHKKISDGVTKLFGGD